MNRTIFSLAIAALLACVASTAEATTYGRFCATWRAQFLDGYGGDYLTGSGDAAGDFPAAYSEAKIFLGSTQIWEGYLDYNGCTTILMSFTGTYSFNIYTRASATGSSIGPVTIHVQPQCTDGWTTSQRYVMQGQWNVTSLLPGTHYYTYHQPAMSAASRDMPVFGQIVKKAAIQGELGNLSSLYTRVSHNTEDLCQPNAPYNCTGTYETGGHICVGPVGVMYKYCLAHEFGHAASIYYDGPRRGSWRGDEGAYNANIVAGGGLTDGICDDTVASPGSSHCMNSREFIGAAYSEGYGHFISSAVMNNRWSAGADLVYWINVMDSTGNPNAPPACGDDPLTPGVIEDWCEPPYDVPLVDTNYVTWAEYECSPIGMSTEHFGTEWDWLRFFWSLWSGSPMWDVDEIAPMWHLVDNDDRATLCCNIVLPGYPYPPSSCTKTNYGTGCGTLNEEIVGKLWTTDSDFSPEDQVLEKVKTTYGLGSAMYNRFVSVGDNAKVDY